MRATKEFSRVRFREDLSENLEKSVLMETMCRTNVAGHFLVYEIGGWSEERYPGLDDMVKAAPPWPDLEGSA